MKLFAFAFVATFFMTVESTYRDLVAGIGLTGEENSDELMEILAAMAGGEVDEISVMIDDIIGDARMTSEINTRKFRHLKILVLWLQKEQKFGRYCFYGCYCLPEGSHNIASGGYGTPVDGIDRACLDFKKCYKCLIHEHEEETPEKTFSGQDKCRGEAIGYKADLTYDENYEKIIVCQNEVGSCKRNICECDKALAMALSVEEDNWDEDFHSVKGDFRRDDYCYRKPDGQGYPFVECCGDTSTFPFNQPRRENQCCDGTRARALGKC